jgi:putative DNA primase/helicase
MEIKKELIAELARCLGGKKARPAGRGWLTCCPAHDDRNPSLSLSVGNNGVFVFHCHAGCAQTRVLRALISLGLWPFRP